MIDTANLVSVMFSHLVPWHPAHAPGISYHKKAEMTSYHSWEVLKTVKYYTVKLDHQNPSLMTLRQLSWPCNVSI